MRKSLVLPLMIAISLLLAGCSKLTQYTVSEQEVNEYLQQHNEFERSLGVPGLVNANMALTQLKSDIGRAEAGKVRLMGNALVDISSLLGREKASMTLTLQAQPWYDADQGAIYLKNMKVIDYQIAPEHLQSAFAVFAPYLDNTLKSYFDNRPAYVLDADNNKNEAMAKRLAKGLEVRPGQIVIPFTR